MRFLRAADVPASERDRVFRYPRVRAIVPVVGLALASAALCVLGASRHAILPFYVAGVVVAGILILHRLVLARFRPSNWLVRSSDTGLYLQIRSYLNHHFPADDLTVAFVGFGEIRSARLVRQRRIVPEWDESPPHRPRRTELRVRYLELELDGDLEPLARALAAEGARLAERRNGMRYQHRPVQLESRAVMRIEWGVSPRAEVLLDLLRSYTRVEQTLDETRDFTRLASAGRTEQERRLTELASAGREIDAIALARTLYGYDLARAKAVIDGLRDGNDARGGSSV